MSNNPYETPEADVAPPVKEEAFSLREPVTVDAGRGWGWIADGFGYFKKSPLAWIVTIIVWFIVIFGLNFIPIIGQIAMMLLTYVLIAGFMIGCRAQDEGKDFEINHLFAGFKQGTGKLVLLSLIVSVISMVVMGIALGGMYFNMLMGNEAAAQQMSQDFTGVLLSVLIAMALMLPLFMAVWFAPALIALHDVGVGEAMKMSFMGCLKNILPFLVYGILALVLYVVAIIPLFLGLLVFFPTVMASMYAAYKDIYIAK